MSSATVFASEEALPDGSTEPGIGELFDTVDSPQLELPCRVGDPDLWFSDSPTELEQAKRLCADCPVRTACFAGAVARREPWGVWGGEIFERGAVVARKRPRGRPRKNAAPQADASHRSQAETAGHTSTVTAQSVASSYSNEESRPTERGAAA